MPSCECGADSLVRMIEPQQASQPQSLYDAVGGEPTFRRIVGRFYELVAGDEILRPLYPDADLGPAEERLRLYLVEHWGGPAGYTALRGPSRLAARHMPFQITRVASAGNALFQFDDIAS